MKGSVISAKSRIERRLHSGVFRDQLGVNVVEFLLIVAILVVLALLIIPNINVFLGTDKKIAQANVEALNIRTAAVAYESNESRFPTDSEELLNGDYIGEPRAYYTFDVGTGRILNATVDTLGHLPSNPWSGIRWDYISGSWVKQ
jgi:competence protein ComGC